MRILITGGCGFVGHHFVEHFLKETDFDIVILDKLTYASNGLDRLRDINAFDDKRVLTIAGDFSKPLPEGVKQEIGEVDYILHLGGETHVDNSIVDPEPFITSNVLGTMHILNFAREVQNLKCFFYFSCYDEKTRAVTKKGLKKYSELKKGDIVFTINPKTREIEEQKINKIIIQNHNGEMIKFDNSIIDLLVTPNHRVYNDNLEVIEAENCLKKKKIKLPIGHKWQGKKDKIKIGENDVPLKDLFYLIGIFLGDGFTAYQEKKIKSKSGLSFEERQIKGKDVKTGKFTSTDKIGKNSYAVSKSWRIFIDIPESDDCRKTVENTLDRLKIKWSAQKGKAGEHIYFTSKEWLEFFEQFGKGAKNKKIPKWVLEYDAIYLEKVFEGLLDSDGHWPYRSFSTVSDDLADGITEVAVKIGLIPTRRRQKSKAIYEDRVIEGESNCFNFTKERKGITRNFIKKENYNGKIWSIKVENENFLVERNGHFAFSGNTDEVFGPAPEGVNYVENDRHNPSNPYAATKSGAEMLVKAYRNSYKLPCVITRSMNIIGERQHPEKFIPMCINKILAEENVIIHANANKTKAGTRFYIHARNVADGYLHLIKTAEVGEKKVIGEDFHITGEREISNLEIAQEIAKILGKKLKYEMVDFHSSRPGHDLRYALDGSKMERYGWAPPKTFEESLKKLVKWSIKNKQWL